jgi:hypothetical protein
MPPFISDVHTHWLPKHGHSADEYEDATTQPVQAPDGTIRAAVADGATESAFAGAWARTLVEEFVRADVTVPRTFAESIHETRRVFGGRIAEHATDLPWYAATKAEEGAYAAFLGLVLYPNGAWRGVAVGDCCLFQIRDGEVLEAWPLDDPDDFGNRPDLLGSRLDVSHPQAEATSAQWTPGDHFLLVSDALAAYLLAHDPAAALGLDAPAFESFVAAAREDGMRNDDVTLLELVTRP